jgi:predicted DNA-binding transcriptional regulator AlpA
MPTLPTKPRNSVPSARLRESASFQIGSDSEDQARLLTEREAADLLTLSVKTLWNWRLSGYGPPHLKVGRLVRYRQSDLKAWLKSCERASTSDRGDDHA